MSGPAGSAATGPGLLARAALGLYPPAWRARYRDEVGALLEDSGAGLRAAASLAWRAVPAWVWPSRHLYGRPERMRASLGTVLAAWAVLAGLAAVFVQLAQAQGSLQHLTLARYPVIQWSYWVFDGAVIVSVLAVVAGGLPLWLRMFRDARGARRRREVACLLAPVAVPGVYLAVSAVIASLVRRAGAGIVPGQTRPVVDLANGMVGPWWFLAQQRVHRAVRVLSAGAVGWSRGAVRLGRARREPGRVPAPPERRMSGAAGRRFRGNVLRNCAWRFRGNVRGERAGTAG